MNPRQRVLSAIRHEEPDRVPIEIGLTPDISRRVKERVGRSGIELTRFLGCDVLGSPFDSWDYYGGTSSEDGATYVDTWGITRIWISQPGGGSYTEVLQPPLAEATTRDLDQYAWPDLTKHPSMARVGPFVKQYGSEFFIQGYGASIFEGAFNLIGYERFLRDLVADRPFIDHLLDIITEIQAAAIAKEASYGVDTVYFMDDPSGQRGMLLSPSLWREVFKPRYAYMIQRAREVNSDVIVSNHNCGDLRAIIPDWLDLGLQMLNPVQPRAMDPAQLKRLYGDRLCFVGAVDEQQVLPFGSPEDVVAEVRRRLEQLAPGGGYIIGPSHAIQADTPVENVLALSEAAQRYGRYPLAL